MKNSIIEIDTSRLDWRKIATSADLNDIPLGAMVAVRVGNKEFLATRAQARFGMHGFRCFDGNSGLTDHMLPCFMAVLPNGNLEAPWDGVCEDGWIDVDVIGGVKNLKQGNYELDGPWRENGYPYDTIHAFRYKSNGLSEEIARDGHWAAAGGGRMLPDFFETAVVRVRKTQGWPEEWAHKMPQKQSEADQLRARVAELEAKLENVARAAKGGAQ